MLIIIEIGDVLLDGHCLDGFSGLCDRGGGILFGRLRASLAFL